MEKKYQVFVSSTYQDLIEERQKVIEALLGKNCFPVGMEYFPAANEDQFTVIKKLIDRCDYYILIIGGRYGSIEPKSGKSYTQLEFEYAISRGIPVASFYHAEPSKLPAERVESTDMGKQKLGEFKKIVQGKKLCDSWKEPYELAFKVNKSLDYLFENNPRVGWVKADEISSAEANKELLRLKDENEALSKQIITLSSKIPEGTDIYCQADDVFTIRYSSSFDPHIEDEHLIRLFRKEYSWNEIFLSISTLLLKPVDESDIRRRIEDVLLGEYCDISEPDFQTIIIQLMALKLIQTDLFKSDGLFTYWILTPYGRAEMVRLKAIRK
jgi:hypothetical protein|nr:MAG TPA: deoxyribosyltransferase [Caudoviricetes sp.]